MHLFTADAARSRLTSIFAAFGPMPTGAPARLFVWDDPNDDGILADAVLIHTQNIQIANGGTNILNDYVLTRPVPVTGKFLIGISARHTGAPDQRPIPIDQSTPYPGGRSFYAGTNGTFNATNLLTNMLPPTDAIAYSFGGYSLLRAAGAGLGITYQGELREAGVPAAGQVSLRFRLFDAQVLGAQFGPTVEASDVQLEDGRFTVSLPFAENELDGHDRWIEIEVDASGSGSYTRLSPRQYLAKAPMAYHAVQATVSQQAEAVPWTGLSGVPAGFADGIDNDSGGDITAVTAGAGLTGGATSGSATLAVSFAGDGVAATAARSDHTHTWNEILSVPAGFADGVDNDSGGDITAVTAGSGLTGGGTAGSVALSVSFAGTGSGSTAARSDHYHNTLAASDGSPSAAVLVDAAGQVGINTAAPLSELHLGAGSLWVGGTDSGGLSSAAGPGMRIFNSTANSQIFAYDYAGTAPRDLVLQDPGGRVGIGTAPAADLHVRGNGVTGEILVTPNSSDQSSQLTLAENTSASYAIVLRMDGTNATGNYFRLRGVNAGVESADFMTISRSNGRVGLGRVASANTLEVEGSASKAAAGSWLANSDARIKTDVRPVTHALDLLSRVRLVSFEYAPWYLGLHPALEHRRYLNVIAQEFASVFPEHVRPSGESLPDGSPILQVDTYPLTIYAAAGVQELHAQMKAVDERVKAAEHSSAAVMAELETLRRVNRELKTRLDKLEAAQRR